MEAQGFSRTHLWATGPKWLPDATYELKKEVTAEGVMILAKNAVAAAKQKARILVIPTSGPLLHSQLLPVEDPSKGRG